MGSTRGRHGCPHPPTATPGRRSTRRGLRWRRRPRLAHLVALAALAAGAVYLVWRWGFTIDGADLWLAIPLAVAETYGLLMLVLLTFSCWRLAARPRPCAHRRAPRGGARGDLRRGRGRPASHGRRRAGHPQRRRARGVGARRRRPRLGARDVRRAGRPLPEPLRAPPAREGRQHQPRPGPRRRRVPGHPRRRPRAAPGADRADARPHGRPPGRRRPGAAGLLQPRLRPPARRGRPAAQRAEHLLRRHLPRQGPPRGGLLVRLPLGHPPRGAGRGGRGRHRHRRRGRPHQPAPQRRRLARGLPQRGHGARPGARGDRRVRRPAGALGARLPADAAARPAHVQARPHQEPAARVHGQLPALPRGPPAPDRAHGPADRARHRRHPDRGGARCCT